jgi:uncharacterized protein (TIRG00374 family)
MGRFGKKSKLAAKVAISAGIIYVLFSQLDWEQATNFIARANPLLLGATVLIMFLDRVLMAWKWQMLLGIVAPAPSLYEAIRVYYVSSFQGIALPLGGLGPDLVRYAHLRSSRISAHAVGVSIFMERIIGLLATVIMTIIASAVLVTKVGYIEETSRLINWIVLGGGAGAVGLTVLLFSRRLQRAIYSVITRTNVLSSRFSLSGVSGALRQNSDAPGALLVNLALSLVEQLFPVAAFVVGGMAFQIPLEFSDYLAAVPISTLLQRLPISYAGLGIREGVLVFLFGLLGVSYSSALILSTTMFIVYLFSLIPGAVWSLKHRQVESAGAG